jgi:hypothetical protein
MSADTASLDHEAATSFGHSPSAPPVGWPEAALVGAAAPAAAAEHVPQALERDEAKESSDHVPPVPGTVDLMPSSRS